MSSAASIKRSQRSQVSPSCPSIMTPTRMVIASSPLRDPGREPGSHVYQTAGRGRRDKLGSAAAMGHLQRLLLLIPTTTYRTEDFVEAARTLDVDLVIASDRPNVMSGEFPDHLLTLPFKDPAAAAREMRAYASRRPIYPGGPGGGATTVVASAIGEALGLRVNPLAAAQATRNKRVMRELLAGAGVPSPSFAVIRVDDDPHAAAGRVTYPCVLKPLVLSASRGVIRADDRATFVAAFARIAAILRAPDVVDLGAGTAEILVEWFVPGTPARRAGPGAAASVDVTARAARALGLSDGAVHAELRLRPNPSGVEPV